MKKPEILSPAGNMERLEYALAYGADAVYIGGRDFSLRAKASNFSIQDIARAAETVHAAGKKLYVTLNIFARNGDLANLKGYARDLADARVDAVIVADPGVLTIVKNVAPGLQIHISTQANVTNTGHIRARAAPFAEEPLLENVNCGVFALTPLSRQPAPHLTKARGRFP